MKSSYSKKYPEIHYQALQHYAEGDSDWFFQRSDEELKELSDVCEEAFEAEEELPAYADELLKADYYRHLTEDDIEWELQTFDLYDDYGLGYDDLIDETTMEIPFGLDIEETEERE